MYNNPIVLESFCIEKFKCKIHTSIHNNNNSNNKHHPIGLILLNHGLEIDIDFG